MTKVLYLAKALAIFRLMLDMAAVALQGKVLGQA